ncbi:zinc finger protein 581 [Alligator sinensis]|uniref:Zinc finger protein 581 n=1 Tax=Alligator sinensis TaxID=38654 RepID=A0A1U8D6C2_ALLSI|nr:zinc finger protein 581 [Alligator sinensis]
MELHTFGPRSEPSRRPKAGGTEPGPPRPTRLDEPPRRRAKLDEDREEGAECRLRSPPGTSPALLPGHNGHCWPEGPTEPGTPQGEPSRYGRYLLIDSQGLPYTVLVEEAGGAGTGTGAGERAALRKVYCCPVCSRTFEYLSYLQRHSITHSEHKPHVCRACGKAFKRTSHLERHKYTHAARKPHQCPICQRSFRDSGELAHHQRVHTGERPYQCDDCHMRFGERNTLQRHIRRKHLRQPPTP